MAKWRVVDTDNFNGDYPNEKFVGAIFPTRKAAQREADRHNSPDSNSPRWFKVVKLPYTLQPGFEP